MKLKRKTKNDYINNAKFFEELTIYIGKMNEAIENNKPKPQITKYIGESIIDICQRMSMRPNFSGYSRHWKEEMVQDAILNCLASVDNFNPEQAKKNPFGYFSRIAWNAFLRRIALEKEETYAKHKNLEIMSLNMDDYIGGSMLGLESHNQIIKDFEDKKAAKKNE